MNSDYQAILQSVLDNPEDDAPRLILADVLDDLGQHARAQYIRSEIQRGGEWQAYVADHDAEGATCTAVFPGWEVMFPCHFNVIWSSRGFIESVHLTAEDWINHADQILAEHPIQNVTLTTYPNLVVTDKVNLSEEDNIRQTLASRWPRVKKWYLPIPPSRQGYIDATNYRYLRQTWNGNIVQVQASNDQINWVNVAEPYDARGTYVVFDEIVSIPVFDLESWEMVRRRVSQKKTST